MSNPHPVSRDGLPWAAACGLLASFVLALLIAAGCGPSESKGGGSSVPQTEDEIAKAKQVVEQIEKFFPNIKPTDPLAGTQVGSFLPDAPDGWKADPPEYGGDKRGDARFTDAVRNYHTADYSRTATVRIRDTGGNYIGYAELVGDIEGDTTDGRRGLYAKTTQLDGFPSRELGYHAPKGGVIVALVGRFGVRIEAFGIDAMEAKAKFWKPINTADLAKIGQ